MPNMRKPGPTYVKQSGEIGSSDREEYYRDQQKLGPEPEENVEPVIKGGQPGKNNAGQQP